MTMSRAELVRIRDEAAQRELARRPRELQDIGRAAAESAALVADLKRLAERFADAEEDAPGCPALGPDEESCECDSHYVRGGLGVRVCPLTWYKSARQSLAGELALCGYGRELDPLRTPVAGELRKRLELRPEVTGLQGLLELVDVAMERGFRGQAGHLALIGTPGSAKTHALLTLYFAALQEGIAARWVESAHLARLAQLRDSKRDEEADHAASELRNLRAAKLLFLDDLGDRITDPYCKTPGSSKYAALLLDLLNKYTGRVFWSSNLGADGKKGPQLADHPDIGPRLLSRLLADHRTPGGTLVPVLGAALEGLDQRRQALRSARRESRVVSRLERSQSDAA